MLFPLHTTKMYHHLGCIGLLLLTACTAGPDYQAPAQDAPAQWQADDKPAAERSQRDAEQLQQWWQQFNDPVLDDLIAQALAANINLQTARAQLREARARRDMATGQRGPELAVSAGAGRNKTAAGTANHYNAGFDASWEPDIFGALRRAQEAAVADVQASVESLHTIRVSLVAEVARNYIDLRSSEKRLAVAEASLAAQTETLELIMWRLQAGMVSELDAMQARTQLEQTRADLPVQSTAIAEARHRLAILLGLRPGEVNTRLQQGSDNIPVASMQIATCIPADTLRQRPDVRAAERRLAAQTARLGEAEAARYPSLRLTGSIGLEALNISGLGDGDAGVFSLLAGISAPIFNGGRIRSNIAAQDAVLEQTRLAYQAAVLTALEDVENALVALANIRLRQQELEKAVASAYESQELTRYRYSAGLGDFQAVLESQRTLLTLQNLLASNTGDVSRAQIQLYKALGGGWTVAGDEASQDSQDASQPGADKLDATTKNAEESATEGNKESL